MNFVSLLRKEKKVDAEVLESYRKNKSICKRVENKRETCVC